MPASTTAISARELAAEGHSQRQIADIVGASHETIRQDLRGKNLPPASENMADSEELVGQERQAGKNLPPPSFQQARAAFVHWWDTQGPGAHVGRPPKNYCRPATVLPDAYVVSRWRSKLAELGVDKKTSSVAQQLAKVPA